MIGFMYKRMGLFVLLMTLLAFPLFADAGFGISPGKIVEDNLVPDSHFERVIYLVQSSPDKDLPVEASVESKDIEDWISFKGGEQFTIPAGIQQFPLEFSIDVPEDAELGLYKAFIRVNTIPVEESVDGQVAIALGGRVDVEITVGDNIVEEYNVQSIEILDIKEGEDLKVILKIENTGNVSTAPSFVSFELFNRFGNVRLAYAENHEIEKTRSFSVNEQEVAFDYDGKLAPGEYWGEIKVYDNDGELVKELRTVFDITEKPLLAKILKIGGITLGILIALAILQFVLFRFIFKNKLRA